MEQFLSEKHRSQQDSQDIEYIRRYEKRRNKFYTVRPILCRKPQGGEST